MESGGFAKALSSVQSALVISPYPCGLDGDPRAGAVDGPVSASSLSEKVCASRATQRIAKGLTGGQRLGDSGGLERRR